MLPVTWTQVPIVGTFQRADGTPRAGGIITFECAQQVTAGDTVVNPRKFIAKLDANGSMPSGFKLPASNDPDISPTGWAWLVREEFPGGRDPYYMFVPYTSASIDLATVTPVVDPGVLSPWMTDAALDPALAVRGVDQYLRLNLADSSPGKGASLVVFKQSGTGAVTRSLLEKLYDTVSVKDFGAKGDGVTDDTTAFQNALNTARCVYMPRGVYVVSATLNVPGQGGILGDGQGSQILRKFSGGPVVRVAPTSEPIVLRGFEISTASGQTIVSGDDGIQLGIGGGWAGRGDIRNLRIFYQWNGFRWEGGSTFPVEFILVSDNKGHGFYGVNPRGEFSKCLAQYNEGNGYFIYAATAGETGVRFTDCGTFCNQQFGLQADAAAGVVGANVWLESRFSSSFDGRGGIYIDKAMVQFHAESPFIEYAGYATNFKPAWTSYPSAKGIQILSSTTRSQRICINNAEVMNCRGGGIYFGNAEVLLSGITKCINNGTGLGSGGDRVGLAIQDTARVHIQSLYTAAPDASTGQSTDIALNTANNVVTLDWTDARTVYLAGTSVIQVYGNAENIQSVTAASASTLSFPGHARRVQVTGTTNIDSITPTWNGHRCVLQFAGALTVNNGNNIYMSGTLATSARSALHAYCDGTNWYLS